MVEAGYERGREEKDDVEQGTHADVEPKHGVVVAMRRFFLVAQGCCEATLLQGAGYVGKDQEHRYLAVVGRFEALQEQDAEDGSEKLYGAVVENAPK